MVTAKKAAKKAPAKKQARKTTRVKAKAKPKVSKGLTLQQRLFASEYLKDENATQAAIRAGYTEHTARQQGSRLLSHVDIKALIEQEHRAQIAKVQKDTGITLERTLVEIARGAFHDPRKFFDARGNLKPVCELDDDTAAALAGFEVTEEYQGRGESRESIGFTKKIKMADRKGYLDMLMKHLGGYKKDNEQPGAATANAIGDLIKAMGRSSLPVVVNPTE